MVNYPQEYTNLGLMGIKQNKESESDTLRS